MGRWLAARALTSGPAFLAGLLVELAAQAADLVLEALHPIEQLRLETAAAAALAVVVG